MKRTNAILGNTFPAAVNARLLGIAGKINLCSQKHDKLAPCPPAIGWGEGEEGQTGPEGKGAWSQSDSQVGWAGASLT